MMFINAGKLGFATLVTTEDGLNVATMYSRDINPQHDEHLQLILAAPVMRHTLKAAMHALRSFQHGNAATEFAKSIADDCEKILALAGDKS